VCFLLQVRKDRLAEYRELHRASCSRTWTASDPTRGRGRWSCLPPAMTSAAREEAGRHHD
jgi:hypothetical protein